jgi:hypothetical protein
MCKSGSSSSNSSIYSSTDYCYWFLVGSGAECQWPEVAHSVTHTVAPPFGAGSTSFCKQFHSARERLCKRIAKCLCWECALSSMTLIAPHICSTTATTTVTAFVLYDGEICKCFALQYTVHALHYTVHAHSGQLDDKHERGRRATKAICSSVV